MRRHTPLEMRSVPIGIAGSRCLMTARCPPTALQRTRHTVRVTASSVAMPAIQANAGRTHYQVLGVQPAASPDEIRVAFRRLAKTLHPDRNKAPSAIQEFQVVKQAYDVLADVAARADYDRAMKIQDMAAAVAAAGRRASTVKQRRSASKPFSGATPTTAARRAPSTHHRVHRVSGDDFHAFTQARTATPSPPRPSHFSSSSSNHHYRPASTASASGSSRAYRSVFDGPLRPPPPQQPHQQQQQRSPPPSEPLRQPTAAAEAATTVTGAGSIATAPQPGFDVRLTSSAAAAGLSSVSSNSNGARKGNHASSSSRSAPQAGTADEAERHSVGNASTSANASSPHHFGVGSGSVPPSAAASKPSSISSTHSSRCIFNGRSISPNLDAPSPSPAPNAAPMSALWTTAAAASEPAPASAAEQATSAAGSQQSRTTASVIVQLGRPDVVVTPVPPP
ncbi:hypothetical protein Agub_g6342, partial [Astrephomene gubernaculifera]